MTKKDAIKKLLAWLNQQVGYHEGVDNWNKYAATDTMRKYLGWNAQNQPWCQIFANAAYIDCYGLDKAAMMLCTAVGAGTALCRAAADAFKAMGCWHNKPEVGDMVFFIVGGAINHVGIVTDVDEYGIEAVEGNSGDSVRRNRYANSYPNIAGYGRPRWEVATGTKDEKPAKAEPKQLVSGIPTLQKGDKGDTVKSAQLLLIGRNFSCGGWGADGDFGSATETAVRNFQTERRLEVDGIIGAATWTALLGVR